MVIKPLADHPECIPALSAWSFAEWNSFDNRSLSEIESQLRGNLRRDSTPITFVALRDAMLIGTVSLDDSDLPPFDHLSPWLASLYVAPAFRGAGVGRSLIMHVIRFAREIGIASIYLWTPGSTRLYEGCGYRTLQTAAYGGQPITLMELTLGSGSRSLEHPAKTDRQPR